MAVFTNGGENIKISLPLNSGRAVIYYQIHSFGELHSAFF